MTSEIKPRKDNLSKDVIRVPMNTVKGSGDAVPTRTYHRSKSKTTIPKSLRYDLENALVGLCDVWFKEIKPYLVKNNIKLHVHNLDEGDGEGIKDIECDNPSCSHLDPASSAPYCELCKLLFNAANSIESAVSQAANASAPYVAAGNEALNKGAKYRKNFVKRPKIYYLGITKRYLQEPSMKQIKKTYKNPVRKKRQNGKFVERPPTATQKYQSAKPRNQVIRLSHVNSIAPTNSPVLTDPVLSIPPQKNNTAALKKMTTMRKPQMKDASTQTNKSCKHPKNPSKGSLLKTKAPQLEWCPGRTVIPKRIPGVESKLDNNGKVKNQNSDTPLFKNDLVDIIGEKHDKMLKLLFRSPGRSHSSTLYLSSPLKESRKLSFPKKVQPWR